MSILRPDLREPAFRKYEPFLARAVLAERITINAYELIPMRMKAHTFAIRCKDAILAYNRFEYKSDVIPPAPIRFKVVELGEMEVQISYWPYGRLPIDTSNDAATQARPTITNGVLPFNLDMLRTLCYEVSLREHKGFTMLCSEEQESVIRLMEDDYAIRVDIKEGKAKVVRI